MILIRFYKPEYKIEINGVLIFIHLKRRLLYNNLKKILIKGKNTYKIINYCQLLHFRFVLINPLHRLKSGSNTIKSKSFIKHIAMINI